MRLFSDFVRSIPIFWD